MCQRIAVGGFWRSADSCTAACGSQIAELRREVVELRRQAASPLVSPAPEPAPGVSPDGGPSGVSAGAAHTARDSVHSRYQSRLGATFLRLSGAMYGNATVDAAITAIRSPGVVATLFPSTADRPPPAGRPGRRPGPVQLTTTLLCPSQLAARPRVGCAAGTPHVATPPRCWRAARLGSPTACRWTCRAGHPSHRRAPSVRLRRRIIRPWPWSTVYGPPASGDLHHRQRSALQHR